MDAEQFNKLMHQIELATGRLGWLLFLNWAGILALLFMPEI